MPKKELRKLPFRFVGVSLAIVTRLHRPSSRPHLRSNEIIARYLQPSPQKKMRERREKAVQYKGADNPTAFDASCRGGATFSHGCFRNPKHFKRTNSIHLWVFLSLGDPATKTHGQDFIELIARYTFSVPNQMTESQRARRATTFK